LRKVINEVGEALRAKEYKLTPQREKILRVMLENQEQHLSAEDVYTLVKKKSPDVGLATVYRTLELFLDNDIIHSVDFGDGRKRYEYGNKEEGHHHHHAICIKCGKIIEINDDLLEELENQVYKEHGFKVSNHELKIIGYCKECAQ
jgi:Fur family ferric uptake transcriptional regulator